MLASCTVFPQQTQPSAPAATAAPTVTARPTQAIGTADRPIVIALLPSPDTARSAAGASAMTAALEKATGLRWAAKGPKQ